MKKTKRWMLLVISYAIVAVISLQAVYQFDWYLQKRFDVWLSSYGEHIDRRHITKPIIQQDI